MMLENIETEITLEGPPGEYGRRLQFVGIRRLGFTDRGHLVFDFWTTPPPKPRGSWLTCPPISELDYRAKNKTRTSFDRQDGRLIIYDDWGHPYTVAAEASVLDALAADCEAHALPPTRAPSPPEKRPADKRNG